MHTTRREFLARLTSMTAAPIAGVLVARATLAHASTSEELRQEALAALTALHRLNPTALAISRQAKATLVFPKIVKAGLVFVGSYGEGVLFRGRRFGDLQFRGGLSGLAGRRAGLRLRALPDDRRVIEGAQGKQGHGVRRRADGGDGQRGRGAQHLDDQAARGRLCLRHRPAGADGRREPERQEGNARGAVGREIAE